MQGDDGATQRNYINHINEVCKVCSNASTFSKIIFKYRFLLKHYLRRILK